MGQDSIIFHYANTSSSEIMRQPWPPLSKNVLWTFHPNFNPAKVCLFWPDRLAGTTIAYMTYRKYLVRGFCSYYLLGKQILGWVATHEPQASIAR